MLQSQQGRKRTHHNVTVVSSNLETWVQKKKERKFWSVSFRQHRKKQPTDAVPLDESQNPETDTDIIHWNQEPFAFDVLSEGERAEVRMRTKLWLCKKQQLEPRFVSSQSLRSLSVSWICRLTQLNLFIPARKVRLWCTHGFQFSPPTNGQPDCGVRYLENRWLERILTGWDRCRRWHESKTITSHTMAQDLMFAPRDVFSVIRYLYLSGQDEFKKRLLQERLALMSLHLSSPLSLFELSLKVSPCFFSLITPFLHCELSEPLISLQHYDLLGQLLSESHADYFTSIVFCITSASGLLKELAVVCCCYLCTPLYLRLPLQLQPAARRIHDHKLFLLKH